MKQFLSFIRKEFLHILRDPRSLLILLVMPQIMVLLPGQIVKNEVKDIRLAVLDHSHDDLTRRLTDRLYANDYFVEMGEVATEAEAADLFKKGKIDLVVVFGPDFADRLCHGGDASIQILSDGSEPNQASVRVAYAQQVVAASQQELAALTPQPYNIRVNARMLFNPQQRSEMNFVPGIVGMVVLLICCMMMSIAIVRERETGTMEILLASPLPSIVIVLAKIVPYLLISLIDLVAILLLDYYVMHFPLEGAVALYVFISIIYIFLSLMLGLLISSLVSTQLAAMLISLLLIVPTLYLSGMLYPVESMPEAAQVISNVLPTKWFISASRKIMVEGVGVQYVATEIRILMVQGLVLMLLAWKAFKTRLA